MPNTCRKCGGVMAPGKAMVQTYTGMPDFPGDKHPTTVSPGGPGRMVDCVKCQSCGWSVTEGFLPDELPEGIEDFTLMPQIETDQDVLDACYDFLQRIPHDQGRGSLNGELAQLIHRLALKCT